MSVSSYLLNQVDQIKNNLVEAIHNPDHTGNRVVKAALPYFNFYGPFNQLMTPISRLMLVGEYGYQGYKDITNAQDRPEDQLVWQFGKGVIATAIAICGVVHYPLGMIGSTLLEVSNEANLFGQLVKQGIWTRQDLGIFFYKSLTHTLRLGTLLCGVPEILVASIALQIFLELGQSYQECRKGRYIEAISNLGLAMIRCYQITPQVHAIYRKWAPRPEPKPFKSKKFKLQSLTSIQSDQFNRTEIERRAAIDVGSGGTKVYIADVDTRTNEIVQTVFEQSYSVPYQVALEKSPDGQFDATIQEQGLKTFQQIKDVMDQHEVQKVSAIATEAFRKAQNGAKFAEDIQRLTSIPLQIIPQEQEGVIAFYSALAVSKVDPKQMIVWDIGTGSFQITSQSFRKEYEVFKGGLGSVPFKKHITDHIQNKDPLQNHSPNPISEEEYKMTGSFARRLAKKASRTLKEKIKSSEIVVIGIGRLFANSVLPLVSGDSTITRKGLRAFIRSSLNRSDQSLNNPFAHVDVPNCIQVLEVMKALHIQEVTVVNTTTTKGMVVNPSQDFMDW